MSAPEQSHVRSRLIKGAAWIAGARIAVNILGVVSTLVLARLLAPADFGLIALATTMLGILTALTNISLTQAVIRHRSPTREHFDTVWTLNLGRALLIAMIFMIIAVPSARFYNDPRLSGIMIALGFSAIISGLENPRAIMMTRELIFWQRFMLQVCQKLVALIVSITIAFMYRSYWALAIGIIAGQIAEAFASYTVLPYIPRPSKRHWRELYSFSVWLSLSEVINTLNWNFDQILIGKFLGRTDLGFYTVGNNLAVIPTREATAPLATTLFPAFANLAHDRSRLAVAYQRVQGLISTITFPLGMTMALAAEPFVRLVMGEKWLLAVIVIQGLAPMFALQTISSLVAPLAMGAGETKLLFRRDCQAFLYRVPLIALGMYLAGLQGVVYARVVGGTLTIVMSAMVVRQITGLSFSEQIRSNGRCLVALLVMVLVSYPVSQAVGVKHDAIHNAIALAIIGMTCIITYIATLLTLWNLAERPAGAEQEILAGLKRVVSLRPGRLGRA